MSSKRETHFKVRSKSADSGLDLSASRALIDETQWWEAENVYVGQNKVLARRPKFSKWGTTIAEPPIVLASDDEYFSKLIYVDNLWEAPTITGTGVSTSNLRGVINVAGWLPIDDDGTLVLERKLVKDEEYSASVTGDMTFSFNMHAKNLTSDSSYVQFDFALIEDSMRSIRVSSSGIYYEAAILGTWALIPGTSDACDGNAHRIDLIIASGSLNVFVDGAKKATGAWAIEHNTDDELIRITATSDDSLSASPYSIMLSSFILADVGLQNVGGVSTHRLVEPEVSDLFTERRVKVGSGGDYFTLYAAGERYIWKDPGLNGLWTPFVEKAYAKTVFTEFRGDMLYVSYDEMSNTSEMHRVVGGILQKYDRAPNCRSLATHENRVWAAGNIDFPLRAYYCGDRDPSTWVVPSDVDHMPTESELYNAGYIDIPGGDSERITHMYGDFFGMLIICTDKQAWAIQGASPADFRRIRISGEIGSAGDRAGAPMLNDYWIIGDQGISSISSTSNYGDIEGNRLSNSIQAIFDSGNPTERSLSHIYKGRSLLQYYPQAGQMVMATVSSQGSTPDSMYCMNVASGKWHGPFSEPAVSMRLVYLRDPIKETLAIGTTDGQVKFWTPRRVATDEIKLSSAHITGRSVDSSFDMMKKHWGKLRISSNPIGDFPITIKWRGDKGTWKTKTLDLYIPSDHSIIGDDLAVNTIVNSSLWESNDQRMILEFPLDLRSVSLKFEITTSAPRYAQLGWEIDFTVSGYEKEG